MRPWLLLIALLVALPAAALAKPRLAVAPLEGDSGNKVGNAVAQAAEDDAKVTGPKETGKAMDKLGLSGELSKKDLKKLRARLEVEIVIQGTVEGEGKQKTVALKISGKGVKASKFTLKFKSTTSERFRSDLHDELSKRLGGEGDSDDEGETEKPSRPDREDKPEKPKKKKHKKHGDDEEDSEAARHPVTQVAVRVNAGLAVNRRTLNYDATGMMAPQRVGIAGGSARIEAEAYPFATETLKGPTAGVGIYGDYDRVVGESITVPGTTTSASINQSHYSIGVRYRIAFGTSTIAAGVGYTRRKFVADRTQLATPTALDTPDVDYAAVAPGAIVRIAAAPNAAVFIGADVPLLLGAGAIVKSTEYGFADITAFEVTGGVDYALASSYALRFAAEFSQFGLKFRGNAQTTARGVTGATDRTLALTATFAMTY